MIAVSTRLNPSAEDQLNSFLAKFTPEIAALATAILSKMRARYPTALELVYDNYNALAIGFSPTERASNGIFSIALYPRWVSLFFLQAKGLPDPQKLLQGSGSVARHIVLPDADKLDEPAVKALMREAAARAAIPFDPHGEHRLIIKSVSATQRPRRPATAAPKTTRTPRPKTARK
jgi:hypothetical protein